MRGYAVRRIMCWVIAAALLIGAAVAAQRTGRETSGAPKYDLQVVVNTKAGKSAVQIAARTGDQVTITLDSNATTGYKWQLVAKPDSKVLRFDKSVYNDPSEAIPGRGGTETWTFTAAGKGNTSFTLNYARPWEKNTPPEKTQKFTVTVQ